LAHELDIHDGLIITFRRQNQSSKLLARLELWLIGVVWKACWTVVLSAMLWALSNNHELNELDEFALSTNLYPWEGALMFTFTEQFAMVRRVLEL
jgi:hypothetical protein